MVRGEKVPEGCFFKVACVVTITPHHELFMTLRSPEKKSAPNTWENNGGAVRSGEEPLEAAVRELYEETGMRACKEDLIPLRFAAEKDSHILLSLYLFLHDVDLSEIVLQKGETADAMLASPEKMEQMLEEGVLCPPWAQRYLESRETILSWMDRYAKDPALGR